LPVHRHHFSEHDIISMHLIVNSNIRNIAFYDP
jgi:hypothetical protein